MTILLVSANTAASPYPVFPLGMSMVAAALRRDGHQVELFDFLQNESSLDRLGESIRRVCPALVGISIRNIDNVNAAHEERYIDTVGRIVERIREAADVPVLLGGSGFSIMPEAVLERTGADYGIVGEGEELACHFVRQLEQGTLPETRIFRSPPKLQREAIPSAVYDPGLLRFYLEAGRMASIQTKRGCTRQCVYCSYPLLEGRTLRLRDPVQVVDDIERLQADHQADYFFFVDSLFNDSTGAYRQLIDEMLRRKVSVPWTAFFSPGGDLDDEAVEQMKATGLHAAEIGADASTDQTLRGLGKDFLWDDVVRCNELFRRHGITTAHYYMFGGPGETVETVHEGIRNIRELPQTANFMFMGIRILPDTPLIELALKEGLIEPGRDLIEPVYYFSPQIDRDWLEQTLTHGFADRPNCVFPPDALDDKLQLLHKLGFSGSGYDLLVKQTQGRRRRVAGSTPAP